MPDQPARPFWRLPERDAPLIGIGLMILAMFLFSLSDAMAKWLIGGYALAQVLLIRCAAGVALMAPMIWREGPRNIIAAPRPGLQALRVLLSAADVAGFYWAVRYLPLADVMTFFMATPIYAAALSWLILGEKTDWRAALAILAGFIGVLIALNPAGASFGWPALVAFGASLGYTFLSMLTRVLRGTSDTSLAAWQLAGLALMSAIFAPPHWTTPGWFDLSLMIATGALSLIAHLSINRAYKLGEVSVLAPYNYTAIIWALLFGWIVFKDAPGTGMLIGSAIIIASGLYLFYLQRRQFRGAKPSPDR